MTFKLISKTLTPIALLAVMAAAQTFNETTFTTPIQNIRNILEAVGGGLVIIAIMWGLYKFILGDRDSLKRVAGIVVVGLVIFAIGPALEFVTGNAAFNQ
ncbi:MAG TPA: TrbC/VirB2 family protein [Fibrobacteria bacterium]|nr:TrbC/VirB2 family protein [Fibrobacteria bacterium]